MKTTSDWVQLNVCTCILTAIASVLITGLLVAYFVNESWRQEAVGHAEYVDVSQGASPPDVQWRWKELDDE